MVKGRGRDSPAGAGGKGSADAAGKARRRGAASKKSDGLTNGNSSGSKGAKGKGGKNGNKGDGKGSKKENSGNLTGAKTVQEIEAKMLLSGLAKGAGQGGFGERSKERELAKQPLEAKGIQCEVRKHSEMGCAVVTFKTEAMRDAVMRLVEKKAKEEKGSDERPSIKVAGVDVQMRPHFDKVAHEEVKTDIFVAWGRQAEKQAPLGVGLLAESIDDLVLETDASKDVPAPAPLRTFGLGLAPPTAPLPVPPPVPVQVTQAPVFTTQMAPSPMASSPMASSPMVASSPMTQATPQPGNYADLMKFTNWAQPHHVAQQQIPQQAPMPAPPAISPAVAPTPPQQAVVATPGSLQAAPPAPPGSYTQGVMAPSAEMRADAPAFQHSAPQHNYLDGGVAQNYFEQNSNTEAEQYPYWNDQMQNGQLQTPTKRFNIVDPTTGEAIDFSTPVKAAAPPLLPKSRLEIKDPQSGDKIDVRSMLLTPAKTQPGLSIIDPNSGTPIQV